MTDKVKGQRVFELEARVYEQAATIRRLEESLGNASATIGHLLDGRPIHRIVEYNPYAWRALIGSAPKPQEPK